MTTLPQGSLSRSESVAAPAVSLLCPLCRAAAVPAEPATAPSKVPQQPSAVPPFHDLLPFAGIWFSWSSVRELLLGPTYSFAVSPVDDPSVLHIRRRMLLVPCTICCKSSTTRLVLVSLTFWPQSCAVRVCRAVAMSISSGGQRGHVPLFLFPRSKHQALLFAEASVLSYVSSAVCGVMRVPDGTLPWSRIPVLVRKAPIKE